MNNEACTEYSPVYPLGKTECDIHCVQVMRKIFHEEFNFDVQLSLQDIFS